jgi:hypothetical protein
MRLGSCWERVGIEVAALILLEVASEQVVVGGERRNGAR